MKVSVIIPAHATPTERLARVFAALAAQSLPKQDWEIILVDNASPTPLRAPAEALGPDCIVVRENRVGLIHARTAGALAARGDLIVFVDDDNLLDPDYLERACDLHARYPDIGAFGGAITPSFAVPAPAWTNDHLHQLALRDLGEDAFIRTESPLPVDYPWFSPYGAGLVIMRSAVLAYLEWVRKTGDAMAGRVGTQLGGCDDCELIWIGVLRRSLSVAHCGKLRLTHLIPAGRLRYRYFVRLQLQGGFSWGRFLVRHGLRPPETRTAFLLKAMKSLLVNIPRGSPGFLTFLRRWGELRGALRPNG